MKKHTIALYVIFAQSLVATLGSLYYGWFGDPVKNIGANNMFDRTLGYVPCEMCWFARVLMYPIVILSISAILTKDRSVFKYISNLAGLGILLESYQYWFQMAHTTAEVKSVICGGITGASCAAVDVIYMGFVTIPFLCLVAFMIIFVVSAVSQYKFSRQG